MFSNPLKYQGNEEEEEETIENQERPDLVDDNDNQSEDQDENDEDVFQDAEQENVQTEEEEEENQTTPQSLQQPTESLLIKTLTQSSPYYITLPLEGLSGGYVVYFEKTHSYKSCVAMVTNIHPIGTPTLSYPFKLSFPRAGFSVDILDSDGDILKLPSDCNISLQLVTTK